MCKNYAPSTDITARLDAFCYVHNVTHEWDAPQRVAMVLVVVQGTVAFRCRAYPLRTGCWEGFRSRWWVGGRRQKECNVAIHRMKPMTLAGRRLERKHEKGSARARRAERWRVANWPGKPRLQTRGIALPAKRETKTACRRPRGIGRIRRKAPRREKEAPEPHREGGLQNTRLLPAAESTCPTGRGIFASIIRMLGDI